MIDELHAKIYDTTHLPSSRGKSSLHHDFIPESEAGYQDLWRMQRATWGKLGYEPVVW